MKYRIKSHIATEEVNANAVYVAPDGTLFLMNTAPDAPSEVVAVFHYWESCIKDTVVEDVVASLPRVAPPRINTIQLKQCGVCETTPCLCSDPAILKHETDPAPIPPLGAWQSRPLVPEYRTHDNAD